MVPAVNSSKDNNSKLSSQSTNQIIINSTVPNMNSLWETPSSGIILGVMSGVIFLILCILLCYFLHRRRRIYKKRRRQRQQPYPLVSGRHPPDPYTISYSNGYNDPYSFRHAHQEGECGPFQSPYYHYTSGCGHIVPHFWRPRYCHGLPCQLELREVSQSRNPERISDVFSGRGTACDEIVTTPGLFQTFEGPLRDLHQITSRSISKTVENKLIVALTHLVDDKGDNLILDNMGISLIVPPGAVKCGQKQLITLVLNWDLSDNPKMTKEQSLVSPVVYAGPHGLKLEKPCIISYKHCAFDPRQIQVLRSETELTKQKDWKIFFDQEDKSGDCILTQDEVRMSINSFTLFTCVQSPVGSYKGKKWLQVAAFATPLRSQLNHYQIRVYFLNKTPCALQWAIQNEAQYGGRQCCPEKAFLFSGDELDMFLETRYISEEWELVDQNHRENIKFLTIWHGHCPHVSICYKRKACAASRELNVHLFINQERLERDGEKLVIQAVEDNVTAPSPQEGVCQHHHLDVVEIEFGETPMNGYDCYIPKQAEQKTKPLNSSNASSESKLKIRLLQRSDASKYDSLPEGQRSIPHHVRQNLKLLLDPLNTFGNDWRELLAKLGFDKHISYIETKASPTDEILNIIECRCIPLIKVRDILHEMGRMDAVEVLDNFIDTPVKQRAVEHDMSGYSFFPPR
ncbi:hypothetical protein CHS0354_018096 [Potamilus streckersoni]|uniref:Netrin receptor UNC5 n=1 Tax=Potamilus streckersoni TaxID=2493646 RepID=A0AAE0WED4_9BIVA|nr:hypothetical protein CHS0354_018096 [Potamilus streckersoni]